ATSRSTAYQQKSQPPRLPANETTSPGNNGPNGATGTSPPWRTERPHSFRTGSPTRMGEPKRSGMMSSQRGRYSPEFKEAAVREVIDNSRTIADVARSLGVVEQ